MKPWPPERASVCGAMFAAAPLPASPGSTMLLLSGPPHDISPQETTCRSVGPPCRTLACTSVWQTMALGLCSPRGDSMSSQVGALAALKNSHEAFLLQAVFCCGVFFPPRLCINLFLTTNLTKKVLSAGF